MKKPITINIEKLEVITNATSTDISAEIKHALYLYKKKISEFTQSHKSKLDENAAFENKIGLERDLEIIWESFRALEKFIQECKLTNETGAPYENFTIQPDAKNHTNRNSPIIYDRRFRSYRQCPPEVLSQKSQE